VENTSIGHAAANDKDIASFPRRAREHAEGCINAETEMTDYVVRGKLFARVFVKQEVPQQPIFANKHNVIASLQVVSVASGSRPLYPF
jgi:hypothetical protein